jgi:integrase
MAKAYRVLRAMLNTALDDGLIRRNPRRIKGAGDDGSEERPVLSLDEVLRVVEALPERFRVMALLATFTSLRFGELAALTRREVDRQCRVPV